MHLPRVLQPNPRRLLLVALVLATVWLTGLLAGCATPAIQCQMRDDYTSGTTVPVSGSATITWNYRDIPSGARTYGDTTCAAGICAIRMRGEPPNINDVCGLARLGHELAHGLGAEHER